MNLLMSWYSRLYVTWLVRLILSYKKNQVNLIFFEYKLEKMDINEDIKP
jgi:hypothetical protein